MYKSFIMVHYLINQHYLQIVESLQGISRLLDITAGGDLSLW
jgi:hypothetical protein